MVAVQTLVSPRKITAFCKRWQVVELALFGPAQGEIDLLVSFTPQSDWSLFDHIQMKLELKLLFGCEVELVTRRALEQSRNTLLRSEILNSARVLYSKSRDGHVQSPG
jgi:uncharacterized protein